MLSNQRKDKLRYVNFLAPVFIVATSDDLGYVKTMTGDIDYARVLASSMQQFYHNKVKLILEAKSVQDIYNVIKKESTSSPNPPILHLLLHPKPHRTGSMLQPKDLAEFKLQGGRVIVTAIEIAKFADGRLGGLEAQARATSYFEVADQVVFLDENDKQCAIEIAGQGLKNKLKCSPVIPVPPTIPVSSKPLKQHGKNIISFGMIRSHKGFEHVLKLAALLGESKESKLQNKKVYIVGSVPMTEDYLQDDSFQKILDAMYPDQIEAMHCLSRKELLAYYEKQLQFIKPAIPVKLFLNIEEKELPNIFDQCTYSFLPAYRGATLRNSSISSSLANHFITYTHATDVTPDFLCRHGKHQDSVVLISDTSYPEYAKAVLKDIVKRERSPRLNRTTEYAAKKLVGDLISIEAIAKQHCKLGEALSYSSAFFKEVVTAVKHPSNSFKYRGNTHATCSTN